MSGSLKILFVRRLRRSSCGESFCLGFGSHPSLWSSSFLRLFRFGRDRYKNEQTSVRYVWEEPCNSNLVYYQTRSVIDTKHVTDTLRLHEHISRQMTTPRGHHTLQEPKRVLNSPSTLVTNQSRAGWKLSSHFDVHYRGNSKSSRLSCVICSYRYQDVWG